MASLTEFHLSLFFLNVSGSKRGGKAEVPNSRVTGNLQSAVAFHTLKSRTSGLPSRGVKWRHPVRLLFLTIPLSPQILELMEGGGGQSSSPSSFSELESRQIRGQGKKILEWGWWSCEKRRRPMPLFLGCLTIHLPSCLSMIVIALPGA